MQKQFHEAMSFFPELSKLTDTCPTCAIAEAFSCFPLIIRRSPRPPVAKVKMNGIDCYPEIAFYGGDQRDSFPCVVIETELPLGWQIEEKLREVALLGLDVSGLPPMPPNELEKIKKKLLPGQAVVKHLAYLLNDEVTQGEQENNREHSNRELEEFDASHKRTYSKNEFVLECKEIDEQIHWIVNGEDKGTFFVRQNTKREKIIKILYNQIGVEGWVPHETFINACGWDKEGYFPSSGKPGCMQRQLTDIRNFLGVDIEFRKNKGVRFAENVVKSK